MKQLFLAMICVPLFVATGCSPESFVDEQNTGVDDKSTVITFSASMPDEGAQTRISLTRENLDIKLTWESTDELDVCLQYETETEGTKTVARVIKPTNISENGKTADFLVEVPQGIDVFNLYGIYGGSLNPLNLTQAFLPSSTTSGSLDELKENKAVMLTFAKTGIETAAPDLSVDLKHAGSLFCIQLRNANTSSWDNIKKVQLSAATPIGAYANTAVLDLTTGDFTGTISGNELIFELSEATSIASGAEQEFWGWFAPVTGQNWPEISLKVLNVSNAELAVSTNSKPERGAATAVGKAFYFPTVYNGTDLRFIQAGTLSDFDGNVYKTVVIDDLEWMTENLKVTHYRNGDPIPTGFENLAWINLTSGAYSVYPYTATEVGDAVSSEEDMIAQYGLLYNGYAVLDERGLAPEGWRVATDEDYKALERVAGMSEGEIEKTGNRGAAESITYKLRNPDWNIGNPAGVNEFGFNALGGGFRRGSGGDGSFTRFNHWEANNLWTSTIGASANFMYRRSIRLHPIIREAISIKAGCSVRCVRDIE